MDSGWRRQVLGGSRCWAAAGAGRQQVLGGSRCLAAAGAGRQQVLGGSRCWAAAAAILSQSDESRAEWPSPNQMRAERPPLRGTYVGAGCNLQRAHAPTVLCDCCCMYVCVCRGGGLPRSALWCCASVHSAVSASRLSVSVDVCHVVVVCVALLAVSELPSEHPHRQLGCVHACVDAYQF